MHGTCLAFGCPPALKWDEADVLQAKRNQQDPARNAARLNTLLSLGKHCVCEVMGVDPADFMALKRPSTSP